MTHLDSARLHYAVTGGTWNPLVVVPVIIFTAAVVVIVVLSIVRKK